MSLIKAASIASHLEEPRQPFSGGGVERAQTQVLADAPLMCGDRLLSAGV